MNEKDELLEKLKALLHHKKNRAYYSAKLGISEELTQELLDELKTKKPTETFETTKKVNEEKGTLESTLSEINFEPKTVEELAKLHKIDLSKFKIVNYWSKLKPNGKFTSSVFAAKKKKEDYSPEDFAKFLEKWEPIQILDHRKPDDISQEYSKDFVDVELNIADFHLAKKTLEGETLESKEFNYYTVVNELIKRVKSIYNIRKIVFPISNDFFHTDNYQNSTTNGTPQDIITGYNEEYERGFDLLANTINFLATQAVTVEVILVQGNHDRTKGFYVAHALDVFFKGYTNVFFQRHHSVTKYTTVGRTFIGYHHGNCKIEDLPLLFATSESALAFANCKYREVHTGDKHHYMAKEVKGVRIQQMPSLSGTDRWHEDNGYVNQIRAGLALVYDAEKGKIAEFEERI